MSSIFIRDFFCHRHVIKKSRRNIRQLLNPLRGTNVEELNLIYVVQILFVKTIVIFVMQSFCCCKRAVNFNSSIKENFYVP